MNERAFRSVKRACYAGLDSVELRKEVARRIEFVVPFDAYSFSTMDPDTGLLTHLVGQGVPEQAKLAYCAQFYPYDTATTTMDAVRDGETIFSLRGRSPALASAMRPTGLRYDVHVALADRSGLWGDWCIMRERWSEPTSGERAFLERVIPHVVQGLKAAALIDVVHRPADEPHGRNAPTAPAAPAAPVAPAVIVIDARGRPTLRTPGSTDILADLADVGFRGEDGLPGCIVNAAARARERAEEPDVTPTAMLRVRGRSGRWYTARATLAEPDAAGETSVVVIVTPIGAREKAELLTRLYDLSPREREVAAGVARGESTKRIAARLGISPHTVKEHLDRACSKIGVRGRKALVARIFLDGYAPRVVGRG